MRKISKKFEIGNKIDYPTNALEMRDFYPAMKVNFACCNCLSNVQIEFEPSKVQERLFELYSMQYVDIDDLVDSGVGILMRSQRENRPYLTINHAKIAQYAVFECNRCYTDFLFVFGIDEFQPGRDICSISGLWEVKYKS